jgi:hypothetical protein
MIGEQQRAARTTDGRGSGWGWQPAVVDRATDLQLDARRQHFRTADGSRPTHALRIGASGMVLALKDGEHGSRVPVRMERLDLALVIHLNDIDALECD